jgi:hypothetical protein
MNPYRKENKMRSSRGKPVLSGSIAKTLKKIM